MSRAMTGTPLVDLDTPLVGPVGKKAADALAAKLGLHTVGDLVRHYPRRYVDRGKLTDIAGLELGEHVTVLAEVEKVTMRDMRHRRGKLMQVVITDGRGRRLDCTFFNPFKLQKVMVPGLRALFSGQVSRFRDKLQLTHPEFEPIEESEGVRPFLSIYPATQGFDSWQIGRCVRQVLELLADPTDPLPESLRRAEGLSELGQALRRIHLPETEADQYKAKQRLVWDEALGVQLALALRRRRAVQRPAAANPHVPGGLLEAFDARLPYTLTAGQRSVGAEIAADLASESPMNRLVQGDVGAGKTVVALRAMLQVVDNGRQAAMLAPTEVLAAQHARSLRSLLGPLAQAGELGGAEQATRVDAAHRFAAGGGDAEGAAGGGVGRRRHRGRHARPARGPGGVRRPRPGRGRRAAPLRRRAARRPRADAARHGAAPPGDDGDPDPAHGGDDGVRRPGGIRRSPSCPGAGRRSRRTSCPRGRSRPGWTGCGTRMREEVAAGHQVYVVCPRIGGDDGPGGGVPGRPGPSPTSRGAARTRARRRWPCST